MSWWKKIFQIKPKPDALARFKSEPLKLTLVEWQKNEQLVTAMMEISSKPIWRAMMQVMYNECPAFNIAFKLDGTPITDRAALQTQTEGYMMAINNLNAMCSISASEEAPVATFEPEEQMEG